MGRRGMEKRFFRLADGVSLPEMTRRVEEQYFRAEAGIKSVDIGTAGASASCLGVNLACGRWFFGAPATAAVATRGSSSVWSESGVRLAVCGGIRGDFS